MKATREIALEETILEWLIEHGGYTRGQNANFDPARALDTAELFAFIGATQNDDWERLIALRGNDPDLAQLKFIERLARQIDDRGTVEVLRHGVDDVGVHIRLAYFRPASGLNPELEQKYAANRLTVVPSLRYRPDAEVDLVLFVNGMPVATAELKNPLSGQTVDNAIAQYRTDRDPHDTLLGRRAVVHFAVDPDLVMMTTRLEGKATRFLPFNRGSAPGADACGKGNPSNLDGHSTSYLWERVWDRHAWLDILNRFVHVEQEDPSLKGKAGTRGSSMIFPRFHQWDAVLRLEAHAREHGAGRNYLVQHSAGSGKSNTIAWLAHRLASLHDATDRKVFDKVVIVTDRRVLDKQLQGTVYQFEHTHGVVRKIEESSAELAEALESAEAKIIVTTLQKFPFVVERVAALPSGTYAVIVDEAHSSQTGETAQEMKKALAGIQAQVQEGAEGEVDPGDVVDAAVEASARVRGTHGNLSMFAFTATPKGKTLELFGEPPDQEGHHRPFHLYSMRQAIEEGFILDVLEHYTTYETYFRLAKAGEDDPEVEVREASKAIAKYVSLHPTLAAQKAEIVVEHFRRVTRDRIGGRAKAMVVCSSRLAAVRFRQAIDAFARDNGFGDVQTLVAFSGTVVDPETAGEFTETKMNGFSESQTAEQFGKDEYRILVVAEKFQTGFDQPLLHTMFVDKKLEGVIRRGREVDGREPLDVLGPDDAEAVDLHPRVVQLVRVGGHGQGHVVEGREPPLDLIGVVHEVQHERVLLRGVDAVHPRQGLHGVQAKLYALLYPARDRFVDLESTDQEECGTALKRFVSRYAFISQVLPMHDTTMEKRFTYCRLLQRLLPSPPSGSMDLGDEVELTHLRVARTGEYDLSLEKGGGVLKAFGEDAPKGYELLLEPLSSIIRRINEVFGVNLTEADRLHLEGIATDMAADPTMQQQAAVNTQDNFGLEFDEQFKRKVAERLSKAEELTIRLLDDDAFRDQIAAALLPRVYEQARVAHQKSCPIGDLLERPEDQHLEFKSTLRWDLKKDEKSKLVESAVIKTVAGFLNSRFGGTLLVGVGDGGEIVGLEHDYATLHRDGKQDADLFQLHLGQLIENAVGLAAAANVTFAIHHVDGHDLCRVHVEPSAHPVWAEVTVAEAGAQLAKKQAFFIRYNKGTRSIGREVEVQRYIAQRWGTDRGAVPPSS